MIQRISAFFDRLWFTPVPAARLAWVRVLVGAYATWYLLEERTALVRNAGGSASAFQPIGVTSHLTGPISPGHFDLLIRIAIVLGFCFTLGVGHRVLAPMFAAALLWVTTYSSSWSMVFHTENMLALHVVILALAASASAVSIDAAATARYPRLAKWGLSSRATEEGYEFAWPLRCLQLAATLPYVVAGLAKVRGDSGWSWALGENLRDQITMNGLYYEVMRGGAKEITFHVFEPRFTALFAFAATSTLVLELLAPLALLHRYASLVYVAGIMSMHWSILWLMGIPFPYQLYGFAFASFFAFDRLAAWITSRVVKLVARARPPAPAAASSELSEARTADDDAGAVG
jgi:hypothetical protein